MKESQLQANPDCSKDDGRQSLLAQAKESYGLQRAQEADVDRYERKRDVINDTY